jgi:Bacterial Ig domain
MKYFLHKILLFSILSLTFWSCDEIKSVPDPLPATPENPLINAKILYTQPNNFVAFDSKNLLAKALGFTSLKVENNPQFGKLTFNKNGLLIYKADSTKAEGEDLIIYKAINTDSQKDKRDTLKIIITSDPNKIPCNAGIIPDFFTVKVNTPSVLNVLRNDRFCNAILDSTTLQIVENPLYGTASIEQNRVKYVPKIGSEKDDFFLYRVCTGGASPVCMIAGVRIDVQGNTCRSFLLPDLLIIDKKDNNVQIIKVLDNDKICDSFDKNTLKITKQPLLGKVTVNKNQEIEYTQTANKIGLDGLEYSITDKDGKVTLRMLVEIYILDIPVCKSDAKNGEMEVSVAQMKETEFEIPYNLYVTKCTEIQSVNFEKQPTFGTVRADGKKLFYKLKPSDGKEHNDQFTYLVTTNKGETLKANFTVKIKK